MSLPELKVTKVIKSRLPDVDLNNLEFGKEFTDHMFEADFLGGIWTNIEIKPLQNLSIHPGNLAWHYGQSIFEGMKATVNKKGTPMLFRPEMHIKRLNASAERMCMPALPESLFFEAIENLVSLESNWIPKSEGSALYIRPLMFAIDECIGVRPSTNYKFLIMTLPVGPYYAKPVSLKVADKYIRAAVGGVGEAKTAGNYAASLYPAKLANEQGFDQIMWLDAKEFKYIQEVGTMNIFFVVGNKIITPATDGAILKGITRDSAIKILRHEGYIVEEKPVEINEIVKAYDAGTLTEVFGTGTAAVVAQVSKIGYNDVILSLKGDNTIGNIVKDKINKLRTGELIDAWNWIKEVKTKELLV